MGIYLSIYLSVCLSVYLPTYLSTYLSVRPSVCLSVCLSVMQFYTEPELLSGSFPMSYFVVFIRFEVTAFYHEGQSVACHPLAVILAPLSGYPRDLCHLACQSNVTYSVNRSTLNHFIPLYNFMVVNKLDTPKSVYRERTGTEWLVLGLG